MHKHQNQAIFALLACQLAISLATQRLAAAAPMRVMQASGWGFVNVLGPGQGGFSGIIQARISDNGLILAHGGRGGVSGLFIIQPGTVVTVATTGMVLSGTLGTLGNFGDINVDSQGRVLFTADVSGSSLPTPANALINRPAFRWDAGLITSMLPLGSRVIHRPIMMSSAGTWVAEDYLGVAGSRTQILYSTNGQTATPVHSISEASGPPNCLYVWGQAHGVNASGTLLYGETSGQETLQPGGNCDSHFAGYKANWRFAVAGTVSKTVASGFVSASDNSGITVGTIGNVYNSMARINDLGAVAFNRFQQTFDASLGVVSRRQLVVVDANGERLLWDEPPSPRPIDVVLHGFDHAGRGTFETATSETRGSGLVTVKRFYAGPDLANDFVIDTDGMLFGQAVKSLRLDDVNAPPGSATDERDLLFTYTQGTSAARGIALATKGARWVNPAGGAWTTPANWASGSVPESTSATLFDLEASYLVNLDAFASGRMRIENGSVGFRGASMTLSGPLDVGGDAVVTLPEGTLAASGINVGSLPPLNPAPPALAKLAVSGQGTVLSTTGVMRVGAANSGEVRVTGAALQSADTRIGSGAVGTVTVEQANGEWFSGPLTVGEGHTATLSVNTRSSVTTNGRVVLGGGSLSNISSAAAQITDSSWLISGTVILGEHMPARLSIENGGFVGIIGNDLTTGAFNVPELGVVAKLYVSGVSPTRGNTASSLSVGRDMQLGLGDQLVNTDVTRGGSVSVARNMSLGQAKESFVTVYVTGVAPNGTPSQIEVGESGSAGSGECLFGVEGIGKLRISDGARLICHGPLSLGVLPDGDGTLILRGDNATIRTSVNAERLCIGASVSCGTVGSRGQLFLLADSNAFIVDGTVIGRDGALYGNGFIFPGIEGLRVEDGGFLDPGIVEEPPLEPLAPKQRAHVLATSAVQPGTLTISGSLSLSATAVITIDVTSASGFDKLNVTGNAALNGKLVLNFSNGYAPKQGDSFKFVTSPNASGAFANVEIKGLAPGFQYAVTTSGGNTQLVANNNGVATTQRDTRKIHLPLVRR